MKLGMSLVTKCCGVMMAALTVACSGAAQRPAEVAAVQPKQSCPGGAVTSDAELAKFAGCAAIEGDLRISGVSTLEPLGGLKRVQGTLSISDTTELDHLEGLEALESTGALELARNRFFTTAGLENLHEVGRLSVVGNPRLISLAGLNHLRVAADVVIARNPRLAAHYGLLPALERNPLRVAVEDNRGLSRKESARLLKPTNVAALSAAR